MQTPRKNNHLVVLALIALLVASLSCNMPGSNQEAPPAENGLVQDYQSPLSGEAIPEYRLTEAQITQLASHGYPDRFVILFFNETLFDGSTVDIRQESWYYDATVTEIVYRNGEKYAESSGKPIIAVELGQTAYRPEQLRAGMILDELIS